jgi:hypothetical protein
LITLLMVAPLGCAYPGHTTPPHGGAATRASELEPRAAAFCEAEGESAGPPTRAFRTDACSLWPDGGWRECCVFHDIAYWCGGTYVQRRAADRALRACVAEQVGGWRGRSLGFLMEAGVFVGGPPWLPIYWRWGYGHPYGSGYTRSDERP